MLRGELLDPTAGERARAIYAGREDPTPTPDPTAGESVRYRREHPAARPVVTDPTDPRSGAAPIDPEG